MAANGFEARGIYHLTIIATENLVYQFYEWTYIPIDEFKNLKIGNFTIYAIDTR